jgi:hypothetical protein
LKVMFTPSTVAEIALSGAIVVLLVLLHEARTIIRTDKSSSLFIFNSCL